jgi:Phage capsid family
MPLLKTEAEKLSNNLLLSGVIEELINKDEMFAFLPFMQINTKELSYIREDESAMNTAITGSGSFDWLDPNASSIPEAAMSFVEVSAKLRILAGDVDIDRFLSTTMTDTNNQLAIQLAAKAKVIRSKFQRQFAIGDATSNTKEFDGLPNLVSSGQTITAGGNGATLSFDMIDELQDYIPYGADCFVMHSKTWRAIKAMMRALNIQPEHIAMPDVGINVPTLNGVPVIKNDYLATNEEVGSSGAVCTSIYACRFNEADGLHGLYGGPTIIQVENIGTVQTKDAERWRAKIYASIALKSTKSLARLKGLRLS